jgi:hypothetical protein
MTIFEEKFMKVFEIFGHSVVPGITEFWNESNKINLEHTAAKNLLIPMLFHHTVCLSSTAATNGSVFSVINSQILHNKNVYFSCKLYVVVLLDHHQALCIKT